MNNLFINPAYLKMLKDIFDSYCPEAEIWAYGSRVGGDTHDGSDLDLTVKSFNSEICSLGKLKELISGSNIPFFVDINEFDKLPESFQREIEKKFIVLYPNQQ